MKNGKDCFKTGKTFCKMHFDLLLCIVQIFINYSHSLLFKNHCKL